MIFQGGGKGVDYPCPILILVLKKNLGCCNFFLGAISLGIFINLPRTNEKLLSKGEPQRFSGWFSGQRETSLQTDKQRDIFISSNKLFNLNYCYSFMLMCICLCLERLQMRICKEPPVFHLSNHPSILQIIYSNFNYYISRI